jgi:hypothetical protein
LPREPRDGQNASVPAYKVHEAAVRHAKRLIDARQYVLRSRWQDVQPRAREQNAFLKAHSWEEYAAWHLGLTEGAAAAFRHAVVTSDLGRRGPIDFRFGEHCVCSGSCEGRRWRTLPRAREIDDPNFAAVT